MIIIKNRIELDLMKKAGQLTGMTLEMIADHIRPGISTQELDALCEEFITRHGAKPSFKNYHGFTGSICASVNEVVIHGIPSRKNILKEGDIISVDVGAYLNGFHGDAARTFPVGDVSEEARKLIRVTEESFFKGIEHAYEGRRLGDISHAIQKHVEDNGFTVVRDFTGHGIGRNLHEDPQIPNYGKEGRGPRLNKGMVLAIEPMVNVGRYNVRILDDNWTTVTEDGKLSAHYENTVAITDGEPEILTLMRGI
ncbi:type I methionyl aminopeptidase [Youngiibacter fragilis]|uniref:Methionine aminopeptidase n=1 Tax=Youngiibacter fragilis 232.1 TaxID=994573 RepID=V7I5G2_9CLOT|nr:type I methionyl aminopeptidase [Youngiibacter fragilis]ETA81088.1 methionine aminopeptidase [Youngiibacter fragilis 232.1]